MGYLRSEDERLDLIAAARAMREAGHEMHVIAAEVAVPVSTLYRWAAEGGWRGQDLAQARVREVFARQARLNAAAPAGGSASPDGSGCAPAGGPDCGGTDEDPEGDDGGTGESGEVGGPAGADGTAPATAMNPLEARAAGERAMRAALALMEEGELKHAAELMRLAERMLTVCRMLATVPDYLPPEEEDYREILGRRIERIAASHAARAAEEGYTFPDWWWGEKKTGPDSCPE
ncbi:hypothetical protein [Marinicauda sp. Alg238-R41]|uniref:hypothetical protein n=1 Tax=Marinicauda sp. Alg238-R41 TaxID=2993447 RepID=UPI0022E18719|nr:hypothetical protein [Marinicauda sp. Alg238-R41]